MASAATAFWRAAPIVGFVAVGVCTYVWLAQLRTPFPIHGDGIRDQMTVRDCVELGRCHLAGAPASLSGEHRIFQGAAWLDLLTAVRLLGGDTTTQITVILALDAVAAARTFIVVWHWLQPALALPAAYLVAKSIADGTQSASLLANGSASALFEVMTAAGLLCYALSSRTRFLLVAAFAAALAVNVHLVAATLVPGLLLVAAWGRTSSRDVLAAGACFAAVYLVTSGAALAANLLALADREWSILLLVAVVIVAVESAPRLGARFRALSVTMRAVVTGGVLVLPFAVASLWLIVIERHGFDSRYLHPIWGPKAVFEAALYCAPLLLLGKRHPALRWVPSVVTLCWMVARMWTSLPVPTAVPTWTLTNATTIGAAAASAGWSFEDLVFRLQGHACGELLQGIGMEGPRLNGSPPGEDVQLQVALLDSEPPSASGEYTVVPLQQGQFAALRSVQSWMQPRGVELCRQSLDRAVPPTCEGLRVSIAGHWTPFGPESVADARRNRADFSFESRALVTLGPLVVPPYVTRYRIPVQPRAGEVREVRLVDRGGAGCRWEFVQADGLRLQNALPATHVRLGADNDGPGVLVIEKPFGVPSCPVDERELAYPPCVLETRPGEAFERLVAGIP